MAPPTWPAPHCFTPTTDKGQPQPLTTLGLVTHTAWPRWVQQAALPGLYPRSVLSHSALSCKLHRILALLCPWSHSLLHTALLSSVASRVPQCGWELYSVPLYTLEPPGYPSVTGSTHGNFQTATVSQEVNLVHKVQEVLLRLWLPWPPAPHSPPPPLPRAPWWPLH